MREVAPGIHLFRPNDDGLGNVVAVVSRGEALVVDATATPKAAFQILASLRGLLVAQLVALVNTHWHDDHVWGNQVFADSFPEAPLLTHPATVDGMRDQAIPALAGQISRLHQRIQERDRQLESSLAEDGSPLGAEERATLARRRCFVRSSWSLRFETPTPP